VDRKQKIEVKSSNVTQNPYSDWGTIKRGVPQGSFLRPLPFIIHKNDLLLTINTLSVPILFTNDTTGIISSKILVISLIVQRSSVHMNKWFTANTLALNLDKTKVSRWLPTAVAGLVVDKVALGQVFSKYLGFPCQSSFHQLLHNHHHLSSGAGTIGQ
jgi:hypothetical protein